MRIPSFETVTWNFDIQFLCFYLFERAIMRKGKKKIMVTIVRMVMRLMVVVIVKMMVMMNVIMVVMSLVKIMVRW